MCGIVGFTGKNEAAPILLDGLSKLEYRGYDSAGIAVRDGDAEPEIVKAKGKLKVLKEMTNDGRAVKGSCGIGHTRWATHGEPSAANAHPHCSDDENVIAVHNGIIENYQELREKLVKKGYTFKSQTDTEVAVKLIDYYYKKYLGTPVDALNHALVRIRGSYALAVMFKDYPGEIYAARKDSPMIIGVTGGETADSLAALRLCKEKGVKTLGIVNVVGSSIAREADNHWQALKFPLQQLRHTVCRQEFASPLLLFLLILCFRLT